MIQTVTKIKFTSVRSSLIQHFCNILYNRGIKMNYKVVLRPNPMDKDAPSKYYATPIWAQELCGTDELAEEISLATSLTPADVKACIACFMQSIPKHLMKGEAVKCESFGIFRLSFSVKTGHEKIEDVSGRDVETIRVLFRPSSKLKELLKSTRFTQRA